MTRPILKTSVADKAPLERQADLNGEDAIFRLSVVTIMGTVIALCLVIVISIISYRSWQQFIEIETQVLPDQNQSLSQLLSYQTNSIYRQFLNHVLPSPIISQKIKTDQTEPASAITQLSLFINQSNLTRLNANLPHSGKQWVNAKITQGVSRYSEPSTISRKAKVRYRGSSADQWRAQKKSWRIKLADDQQLFDVNRFDLLIPTKASFIDNYLGYQLAARLALIHPKNKLIWLTINGENYGLYHLVEQVSEQTLVNANQLPGDIYAGDLAKNDAFIGTSNQLFDNPYLWDKLAFASERDKQKNTPLSYLIALLTTNPINEPRLAEILDYPSFARFYLFNRLIGSTNLDDFHNWRLYYDYRRGRFFPIVWDAEGWPKPIPEPVASSKVILPAKLFRLLNRDPNFQLAVVKAYRQVKNNDQLSQFVRDAEFLQQSLNDWVERDQLSEIALNFITLDDYWLESELLIARIKKQFDELTSADLAIIKTPSVNPLNRGFIDKHLPIGSSADDSLNDQPDIELSPKLVTLATQSGSLKWQGTIQFSGINHIVKPVEIAPGSKLLLDENASLIFHAKVNMLGLKTSPVFILSKDPNKPYAAVVLKGEAANGSLLQHCVFSQGRGFHHDLIEFNAMFNLVEVKKVLINDCQFTGIASRTASEDKQNSRPIDLVNAVYSQVDLNRSQFSNSSGDGLDVEMSQVTINDSLFINNSHEGLDSMKSQVVVKNSTFDGNRDTAISVGQNSLVRIERAIIHNNKEALLVKDGSALRITNSRIKNNLKFAKLFQDNKHYSGGGEAFIYHSQLWIKGSRLKVSNNSSISIIDSFLENAEALSLDEVSIDKYSDANDHYLSRAPLALVERDKFLFAQLDQKNPPHWEVRQRGIKEAEKDRVSARDETE